MLLCSLGLTWGALGICAGNYVNPTDNYSSDTAYTFANQTSPLALCGLPEWSVFNATDSTYEAALTAATFELLEDTSAEAGTGATDTYLDFASSSVTQSDETTFLSLVLSNSSAAAEAIPLTPTTTTDTYRRDYIYVEMQPVESESLPDMSMLQKMYASASDSAPDSETYPLAAKLGLIVGPDGYFYVSRVLSGSGSSAESDSSSGTGQAADAQIEWCNTKVAYGSGRIQVRFEIITYNYNISATDASLASYARAYRVWVKKPSATMWTCLTTDLGYDWMSATTDGGSGYYIDFSRTGDWLFFIDETVVAANPDDYSADVFDDLDSLQQIGFSATDGRLYAVWLDLANENADTSVYASMSEAELTAALGSFASYVGAPGSSTAADVLAAWMERYGVTFSDLTGDTASTVSLASAVSLASTTSTSSITESAYEAFLLNIPTDSAISHSLVVTGIVPEENQVTITVQGPAFVQGTGSYKLTNLEAAEVLIRRSATLDTLEGATPTRYTATANSDGSLTFVMPRAEGDVELPFMRAELSALTFSK